MNERRLAGTFAYAAAVCNAAAVIGTAFLLRPGTPENPDLVRRMSYVHAHAFDWSLGWFIWLIGSVTMVGFFLFAGRVLGSPRTLRKFALYAALVGLAGDMICLTTAGAILPRLRDPNVFAAFESLYIYMGGGVANGWYSIAGMLINLMMFRSERIPKWLALLGVPVWIAGMALTIFTFAGWMPGVAGSTAAGVGLFAVWAFLGAPRLSRAAPPPAER